MRSAQINVERMQQNVITSTQNLKQGIKNNTLEQVLIQTEESMNRASVIIGRVNTEGETIQEIITMIKEIKEEYRCILKKKKRKKDKTQRELNHDRIKRKKQWDWQRYTRKYT